MLYLSYMIELIVPTSLVVSSIVLGIIWIFLIYLLGRYVLIPLFLWILVCPIWLVLIIAVILAI